MIKGILIVNKPKDYTSRDVVNVISKIFQTKKVGHSGTLDPLASGVLVICLGRYTKLVDLLTSLNKEYIANIKLGISTDTLDTTGEILLKEDFNTTQEEIEMVFNKFIGNYKMEVPIYSAIKVKGKKLYQYARNKEEVVLPVKNVQIYDLKLLEYNNDTIRFKTKVEKGTYIRSLIRDICKELKTVGVMSELTRTKQGNFKIEDAYTLEEIKNGNYKLLSIKEAINISTYELSEDEYFKVKNGNKISLDLEDKCVLLMHKDEEIAVYKKDNDVYKCYVMIEI